MIWVYKIIDSEGTINKKKTYVSEITFSEMKDIFVFGDDIGDDALMQHVANIENHYFPNSSDIKEHLGNWWIDNESLQKYDCTLEEFVDLFPEYFV